MGEWANKIDHILYLKNALLQVVLNSFSHAVENHAESSTGPSRLSDSSSSSSDPGCSTSSDSSSSDSSDSESG